MSATERGLRATWERCLFLSCPAYMIQISSVFHTGNTHPLLRQVLQGLLQDLPYLFTEATDKRCQIILISLEQFEIFLDV
jgi:hypothetical protein